MLKVGKEIDKLVVHDPLGCAAGGFILSSSKI